MKPSSPNETSFLRSTLARDAVGLAVPEARSEIQGVLVKGHVDARTLGGLAEFVRDDDVQVLDERRLLPDARRRVDRRGRAARSVRMAATDLRAGSWAAAAATACKESPRGLLRAAAALPSRAHGRSRACPSPSCILDERTRSGRLRVARSSGFRSARSAAAGASSSATGRCSTPLGTTKISPGSSSMWPVAQFNAQVPLSTRKKSSVSSCLCQVNGTCSFTIIRSWPLKVPTVRGRQCSLKVANLAARLIFSFPFQRS